MHGTPHSSAAPAGRHTRLRAPRRHRLHPLAAALAAAGLMVGLMTGPAGPAIAQPSPATLPQGPQVVAGQASVLTQGTQMTVRSAPGTILNWQSFSIGASAGVHFDQTSATSKVLNRVVGQDPSQIFGQLTSNGQVWLLNPHGVLFGQGARVDVGGLVTSTLALRDTDFLAGRYRFVTDPAANPSATVRNEGRLSSAYGGQVVLLGGRVDNAGDIEAPGGQVTLAAARAVELLDTGLPHLAVRVDVPEGQVLNLGRVMADGGTVDVIAASVNQLGLVRADTLATDAQGRVVLRAGDTLTLGAGSTTQAVGGSPGLGGGAIDLLGARIALAGDALVDVSGSAGGGGLRVGGGLQGRDPTVPNADALWFGPHATLRADALGAHGTGGSIILWSNQATRAYGTLSARGGLQGGDGGFVETSGGWLDARPAKVDVSSRAGAPGRWLLDPNDILITDLVQDVNVTAGPNFTSTDDASVIGTLTLTTALNSGTSVTVTTAAAGANTQAGDIRMASATLNVAPTAPVSLTLTADRDILVENSTVQSTGSALSLGFNAGRNVVISDSTVNASGTLSVTAAGNLEVLANTAATRLRSTGAQTVLAAGLKVSGAPSGTNLSAVLESGNDQTLTLGANGVLVQGGGGTNNTAEVLQTGAPVLQLSQSIVSGNGISIIGGANGTGNTATIQALGLDQTVQVGPGGLQIQGGSGTGTATGNQARLRHDGTGTQTVRATGGSSISLTGGSSAGLGDDTFASDGSYAEVWAGGTAQNIVFSGTTPGILSLTGGTVGAGNSANFYAVNSAQQTITGASAITLTGGSSGGVAGANASSAEGNFAHLGASGAQTLSTGTLTLAGGAGGVGNTAAIFGHSSQSISGRRIQLFGGGGANANAAIYHSGNSSGNQAITAGTGGLSLAGGSGNNSFAHIDQYGTGAQTVQVNDGGSISLQGGSASGAASGAYARFAALGASQSITFSAGTAAAPGDLTLAGGGSGSSNYASVGSAGPQAITGVSTLTIAGGAGGTGNSAYLLAQGLNQTITVGAGGLSMTGGDVASTGNQASIVHEGTGTQTVLATDGGSVTLVGGSGTGSYALIRGYGSAQNLTFTGAPSGSLSITGGTVGSGNVAHVGAAQQQTITGAGSIAVTGGGSVNDTTGQGNDAQIYSTGAQSIAAETITITGGAGGVGNNWAGISVPGTQSVSAGSIWITGGASGTSNHATISGGAVQTITGADIQITGGGGTDNYARIGAFVNGAQQQINLNSGPLLLRGGTGPSGNAAHITSDGAQTVSGASILTIAGGAGGTGNSAYIQAVGLDQTITVGAGGLSLTGGSGADGNDLFAAINHYGTGTQAVQVNDGGSISLLGGSATGVGAEFGNQSYARIVSVGLSQAITFAGSTPGSLTIAGGGAGSNNYATVAYLSSNAPSTAAQIITGPSSITVTGGSGTARNYAEIYSSRQQQITLNSGTLSLLGGSGPSDHPASVYSEGNQTITGVSTLTVAGGVGGTDNWAEIGSGGVAQIIAATDIQVVGGSGTTGTYSNSADIALYSATGQQTINVGGGNLSILGGGGPSGNEAYITSDGAQTVSGASTLTITGGTAGSGNKAFLSSGSGTQNVSAGSIAVIGGASGTDNYAEIRSAGTQTIATSGLQLTGGAGVGNRAWIHASGPSAQQQISLSSGPLSLLGGSGASDNDVIVWSDGDQTITGVSTLTITGGLGGTSNWAEIASGGVQNISANDLQIAGGTGTTVVFSNSAGIYQGGPYGPPAQQTITLNGGNLSLTGGAGPSGNEAYITSNGAQTVSGASTVTITGGAGGTGNSAYIQALGLNQSITGVSALNLAGGVGGTDNWAEIFTSGATQAIAATDIQITGGGGTGNYSAISAYGSTSQQTITLASGPITIVGGSGPSQNSASVFTNGSQSITGVSALTITGGTLGTRNEAYVSAFTGPQNVLASSILLQGGASGTENTAWLDVGPSGLQQTITTTGNVSLIAGAGGAGNGAILEAPIQNLSVGGALSLQGGGSTATTNYDGAARIGGVFIDFAGGFIFNTATRSTINVAGDVTLSGGSTATSGAAIGNVIGGTGTNDIALTSTGGSITLNPGAGGVRIGNAAADTLTGGSISLSATSGSLNSNGSVATPTPIRTAGTVSLSAGSLAIGSSIEGGSVALTAASGGVDLGGAVAGGSAGPVVVQASGNVSLGAGSSITSAATGDALILAAGGNFSNLAGSTAFSAANGRWLVYSANPALDTRGGLLYDFKHYGQTYAAGTAYAGPGTGNGFLYSTAPTVNPGLTGAITKTYDGNTTAALTAANYTATGAIDGDLIVLNNPAIGTYNSKNVTQAGSVSVNGLTVSATDSNTGVAVPVYGYTLSSSSASAAATITPATLSVSGLAARDKVYDGTTLASLNLANLTLTGLISGDGVSVAAGASTFSDPNVGQGKTVTINGLTLGGTDAGNYLLGGASTLTTTASITPAPLTLAATPAFGISGQAIPALSGTVSGFIGTDTLSNSTTGTLTWVTSATPSSLAGLYEVIGGGLSSGNYQFFQAPGNATALTLEVPSTSAGVVSTAITVSTNSAVAGVQPPLLMSTPIEGRVLDVTAAFAPLATLVADWASRPIQVVDPNLPPGTTLTPSTALLATNAAAATAAAIASGPTSAAGAGASQVSGATGASATGGQGRVLDLTAALAPSTATAGSAAPGTTQVIDATQRPATALTPSSPSPGGVGSGTGAVATGQPQGSSASTTTSASTSSTSSQPGSTSTSTPTTATTSGAATPGGQWAATTGGAGNTVAVSGGTAPSSSPAVATGTLVGQGVAAASSISAAGAGGSGNSAGTGAPGGTAAGNALSSAANAADPPPAATAGGSATGSSSPQVGSLVALARELAQSVAASIAPTFQAVDWSRLQRHEVQSLLAARALLKQNIFAEGVARLRQDPLAADLPACTQQADLATGRCLLTPELKRRVLAASEDRSTSRERLRRVVQAELPRIERKIALLVGVSAYSDPRVPQLDGAASDARAVRELLASRLGYETQVLESPTREALVRALNGLALEARPADSVIIYYAGHGLVAPINGVESGFWMPTDGNPASPDTWLANADIARLVGLVGARQVMLVSDSCYSGTLAGRDRVGEVPETDPDRLLERRAVIVMSSGGDEPVADQGKEGHSFFAWHFMDNLRGLDRWSAGGKIFERVKTAVSREFPQLPQYGSKRVAGHETGTDYLLERRRIEEIPR